MKIVCLGDSITWGFPFGPSSSWVTMLENAIGVEVINRGINGNTTSDMLNRFDRAVLSHNPTHVIILGGANDIIWAESFDRIVYNLRLMAEKSDEHNITVIFGLPTPTVYRQYNDLLARIRDWIKNYAASKGYNIIPFDQAFYDQEGNIKRELLLADGAHPAQAGYEEMFKQIDLGIFGINTKD